MKEEIRLYMNTYPEEIICMYEQLRALLIASVESEIEEKLWAKLPSYYAGNRYVRLIPFHDHINIEARTMLGHKDELTNYRLTPKGMLQVFAGQSLPAAVLKSVFRETLSEEAAAK